ICLQEYLDQHSSREPNTPILDLYVFISVRDRITEGSKVMNLTLLSSSSRFGGWQQHELDYKLQFFVSWTLLLDKRIVVRLSFFAHNEFSDNMLTHEMIIKLLYMMIGS
ncbi:hypothetical protein ACJX0J_018323, partial [Zea mays]